jgi:hypothetical protein
MATSGTATFTRNRDQIIASALRKASAFASGEEIDSDSLTDAAAELNAMIKHWQGTGVHIWRTTEATIFLQQSQISYVLASTSTDHATESFTETSLSAAAANGASTISVTSATGIATTYKIAVQLDDGSFHWTTVNGAPSGTTVTLTTALIDSAASGNRVIVYQTDLVRPLKILSARNYNFDSDIETPLQEFDRIEYQELPNKTTEATVTGYYYDRRGGATNTGKIYFWPVPGNVDDAIKVTVARPIQDFNAAGDDADIPQEWTEAIIWNLALRLAVEYEAPERKIARIEKMAERLLSEVNWGETELQSFSVVPDLR